MADQVIKIPRASDKVILEVFKSIAHDRTDITSATGSGLGSIKLGAFSFNGAHTEGWAALIKLNSALLDSFTMRVGGLNITYYRGGLTGRPSDVSPIYDDIHLSNNPNLDALAADDQLNIISVLNKKLRSFDPDRALPGSVSKEGKQLEALHQSTLDRLEQIAEDLINKSTEFRLNIEQQYSGKLLKIEEELAAKKQELEGQYKTAQDALSETEKKLDAKLAAIDDRDNTHVRREIRDRMLDDVKTRIETFGVSLQTSAKRRPVMMGMVLLAFLFMALLTLTFGEIHSIENRTSQVLSYNLGTSKDGAAFEKNVTELDKTPLYLLWGRLAILSLGGGRVARLLYKVAKQMGRTTCRQ